MNINVLVREGESVLNVCFLLGGFQGNGGIGRVTSILVNELCRDSGFSLSTISYCQSQDSKLYDISGEIRQWTLFNSPVSMTKALLNKRIISKVENILQINNIDILVACGALYYPLAIFACDKIKTKCICWEHTNPAICTDHRFQSFCRKFAVKKCDKIVVITKAAEQYYLKKLRIDQLKLEQIYNPLDDTVTKSNCYDVSARKIVSVGRLSYPKNFEMLIDIAAVVLSKYSEWSWDIYGIGELYDCLSKRIQDVNMIGRINLKGQVKDIYERYKEYAFLVMTSRYEGFGMALIEAGANRLPLISFDVPMGPNEIIEDGINGFLVQSDNTNEMIQRIEYLIENSHRREEMAQASLELVNRFNKQDVINKWIKVFHALK